MNRRKRAWLAVLFGWCVMFNAVICCVHSSHAVAATLVSASHDHGVEHAGSMAGMGSEMPGEKNSGNMAASLGCPLCASGASVALSSHWTAELFPVGQPFASSVVRAVPLVSTERAHVQPRAPPAVS